MDGAESNTVPAALYRIGKWSDQEHALFMSAYEQYGKKWRKISRVVQTRNNIQCRTHAQMLRDKERRENIRRQKQQQQQQGEVEDSRHLQTNPSAATTTTTSSDEDYQNARQALAQAVVKNFRDHLALLGVNQNM